MATTTSTRPTMPTMLGSSASSRRTRRVITTVGLLLDVEPAAGPVEVVGPGRGRRGGRRSLALHEVLPHVDRVGAGRDAVDALPGALAVRLHELDAVLVVTLDLGR